MTLTLKLSDELLRELHSLSDNAQGSDEDIAVEALHEYVEWKSHRRAVQIAGAYVQEKNAELYRRLA